MLLLLLQIFVLYAITLGIPYLVYRWVMWVNFGDTESITEGIARYIRGFGDMNWQSWNQPDTKQESAYISKS